MNRYPSSIGIPVNKLLPVALVMALVSMSCSLFFPVSTPAPQTHSIEIIEEEPAISPVPPEAQPEDTPQATLSAAKEPSPTATSRPTPTMPVTVARAQFTDDTALHTPPEDVLKEIDWFGKGGGGGDLDYVCDRVPGPYLGYPDTFFSNYLVNESLFVVCGWKVNEEVDLSIHRPDGIVIQTTLTARAALDPGVGNLVEYIYVSQLDDPEGDYTFTFSGASGKVEVEYNYYLLSGPNIHQMDDNQLLLYGFRPKERVRLLAYRWKSPDDTHDHPDYNAIFHAWQEIQVDERGRILIDTDLSNIYYYVAIGDRSGTAIFETNFSVTIEGDISNTSCFYSGIWFDIEIGDYVYVALPEGDFLYLFEGPSLNFNTLADLPSNVEMQVVGGPACADGYQWWQVITADGYSGWVADSEGFQIFIKLRG